MSNQYISLVGVGIALMSLIGTLFVAFLGRLIAIRLTENNVSHLGKDVIEIKDNLNLFVSSYKVDTEKVQRRLMKIEKSNFAQQVLCEERHGRKTKINT